MTATRDNVGAGCALALLAFGVFVMFVGIFTVAGWLLGS